MSGRPLVTGWGSGGAAARGPEQAVAALQAPPGDQIRRVVEEAARVDEAEAALVAVSDRLSATLDDISDPASKLSPRSPRACPTTRSRSAESRRGLEVVEG